MISDYFSFVLRTFKHRKLRSWLTIIGIFIGIAAVVALISLGQGVQEAVNDVFATVGTDKIIVTPGGFMGPQSGGLLTAELTKEDVETIEDVRGVEHTIGTISKTVKAEYKDQTKFLSLFGLPTDEETMDIVSTIKFFHIGEGRQLKESDKYDLIVGHTLSEEVFDKKIYINDRLTVEGQTFKVIGIQEKSGSPFHDNIIRAPIDAVRDILDEPNQVSMIFVQVKEGYQPEKVKEDIEEALREKRSLEEGKEDFSVTLSEQLITGVGSIISTIQMGLVGVAAISLVVGAIGIMNTMYTSVRERTKEIGIMKAIGAKNREIILLFLIESGLLGLVGGIFGVVVGTVLSKIIELIAAGTGFEILQAHMTPELILFSLLFSFVIGAVSGALPARYAAKLKPVDAMRKW